MARRMRRLTDASSHRAPSQGIRGRVSLRLAGDTARTGCSRTCTMQPAPRSTWSREAIVASATDAKEHPRRWRTWKEPSGRPIVDPASGSPVSPVPISIGIILAVILVRLLLQSGVTSRDDYRCARCGTVFSSSAFAAVFAPHLGGKKRLRCPSCGARTWTSRVPKGG